MLLSKCLSRCVMVFSVVFIASVSLTLAQQWEWVEWISCNGVVMDPCYTQETNSPARIDFHVHWTNGITQTDANFWSETDEACENGTNVENYDEVGEGWLVAYGVHEAWELNGFNLILETVEGHEAFFHNDGSITPPILIRHPNYCAGPPSGYCGGMANYSSFPSTGCATGFANHGGTCERSWTFQGNCADPAGYEPESCSCPDGYNPSPIIVDVDGNGFSLTNALNGVNFDIFADGTTPRISWTAGNSTNAFLALDRNSNGSIDNGEELFGNFTPQPESLRANGFLALAEFDKPVNGGNNDGVINKHDTVFSNLRLWQDTNHNGVSESTELHTLNELGLKLLNLDFKESKRTDQFGNKFKYRAKVKDVHDAQLGRWAWDVFLVQSQ